MSISRFSTPTKTRPDVTIDDPAVPSSNEDQDHPLLLELASLRSSLRKFQHVSHSSSMQLQSKMMESLLCQDENTRLKRELEAVRAELDALRKSTPEGQLPSASSQALSELTLAHRRLSSKLDHTLTSFEESQKLVLVKEAEAAIWRKERDAMGVLLQEWRDRVIQTEKERKEEGVRLAVAEEELRVTKLVLEGLQPGNTLPTQPAERLSETESLEAEVKPETMPSNQEGLQRLHTDFTSSLGASQEKIALLETLADELKASKDVAIQEADEARGRYAKVQREIESIRADDFGAGKVVERYMAFTQKTTQQLHARMQTANNRLSMTVTNLRSQLFATQTLLSREESRSKQLRAAIDELAEGYERETFGRRREVGLRMKALEREERRDEQGRRWADRVRRERTRLDVSPAPASNMLSASPARRNTRQNSFASGRDKAGSTSSTSLSSMLGVAPSNDYAHGEQLSLLWDMLESGLQLFKSSTDDLRESVFSGITDGEHVESPIDGRSLGVDSSLGRILLAQEIVAGLTADLDRETKRNVELEKERLGLLSSKWDEPGIVAKTDLDEKVDSVLPVVKLNDAVPAPEVKVEASQDDMPPSIPEPKKHQSIQAGSSSIPQSDATAPIPQESPTSPAPSAISPEINTLVERLRSRTSAYRSTQKALHDCAVSLSNLRSSRKEIPNECQTALQILLDGIHDVIEDVRVEVEIAIADDDRAAKGHQTVLSLNGDESAIKAANGFFDPERTRSRGSNFDRRLGDVEHDLVELKMAVLDVQSEQALGPQQTDHLDPMGDRRTSDPFANLNLKTVSVRSPASNSLGLARPAVSPGLSERHALGNNMKRGSSLPLVGRFLGPPPYSRFHALRARTTCERMGQGSMGMTRM